MRKYIIVFTIILMSGVLLRAQSQTAIGHYNATGTPVF